MIAAIADEVKNSHLLDNNISLAKRYPHDFTLQYPPRREYFQDSFRTTAEIGQATASLLAIDELLIYIHVPFCEAKCFYCNFAVDTRTQRKRQQDYVEGLCLQLNELDALLPLNSVIPGVDIGGGTPTLLDQDLLELLLFTLQPIVDRCPNKHALSIETTPLIAATQPSKLESISHGGVSRISIGIQSSNAHLLKSINRSKQIAQSSIALANIRQAGFQRINADLIFGLPGQSPDSFRADLEHVVDQGVDSITTYDCLYRGKGRALTRRIKELPSPKDYGRLYDSAYDYLTNHGFHAAYGSVNFSRHPRETGTSPYFEDRLLNGKPYLGLGNYSSSLLDGRWWFAPYSVDRWLRCVQSGELFPIGDCYTLPLEERIAKYVLLSLSFGQLDSHRFESAHGVTLSEGCGPAIDRALSEGWLVWGSDHELHLPPRTFDCLPQLRSLFYPERAIKWLDQYR